MTWTFLFAPRRSPMERHVLVPLDGSEAAWGALEHALDRHRGHRITALHVVNPLEGDFDLDASEAEPEKRSEKIFQEAKALYEQTVSPDDKTLFETAVETGRPAQTIVEYATENDVDQIVMGSRGRSGLSRVLLGSVAETVVRRADVPVTVVR